MTRKLLLAATTLVPFAALPGTAAAQPVSGVYVGAAGGGNFLQQETVNSLATSGGRRSFTSQKVPFDAGYVGLASIGYGFGNGLRVEIEGNYRYNKASNIRSADEQKYGAMANVLFDLDVGSPYIYPYIGGGLGYGRVEDHIGNASASDGSFAYQAIAGLSFPIPPVVGLSLTTEYRFYALAGDRFNTNTTIGSGVNAVALKQSTTDNFNHSLLVGLRYAFNVAPPPVEAAPAAPPQAQASRSYQVFFDWDRADLTDRARQIVAEAAQATQRVQVTRIEVSGHTDTSGTARYNQALSVRRAGTVAAELVRLGVPRTAITTQGYGFSRPLVATGPGVREPQNRRVEIVFK
jgi:outer membrane protein OmpA-like peptidoglycan-associated protein